MKPDYNLFMYLAGLMIGSFTLEGLELWQRLVTVGIVGLTLIAVYFLKPYIRLALFYPLCMLIGHRPIPMIDCEGEQFGKACGRCGVDL